MRRLGIVIVLLAAATFAQQKAAPKKAVATPQTARQALIEMLTTKSDKTFEKHLPEALLVRMEPFKSKDAKTGKSSSPMKTANSAIVSGKDVHFFPTGTTFVSYTEPKTGQKIDVTIDRDDLTADGNDFEFGFHLIKDGKESASAFIPKVLVRMKQEAGKEYNFQRPEQGIRGHELCIYIECRSAVLLEQKEVNIEMNDEKAEKKEPRQGHDNLFAD